MYRGRMSGRFVRTLCLVTAAWAVLFAPGAFRGDTSAVEVAQDANRLAAAVIAPTFSADGLHAARPCRTDDVRAEVCDVVTGVLPAVLIVLLAAGLSSPVPRRGPAMLLVRQHRTAPPRAPPGH